MKLRDFGRLFSKGVSRVEFTLNHRPSPIKATYDLPRQDRVRQRIAQPQSQQQTVQGRLLMADFKETGRQLRIHPSIGQPILCQFPESLSAEVEECIRQFVRVTGRMEYTPSGEPHRLEIADIERIDEPLAVCAPREQPGPTVFGKTHRPKNTPGVRAFSRSPKSHPSTGRVRRRIGKALTKPWNAGMPRTPRDDSTDAR